MKRILINTLLAIGSAFLCSGGLNAQTLQVQADVPFAFYAAGNDHAAGRYQVTRINNPDILVLRNTQETSSSLLGIADHTASGKGRGYISFRRYGNQYFLAEVSVPERMAKKLRESAKEREIRNGNRDLKASIVEIACRQSAGL